MTSRLILAAFAAAALASPGFAPGSARAAGPDQNSPTPPETHNLPPSEAMPILSQDVAGPDGTTVVGRVIDVLVDQTGRPRAAVLDVGGFLGMGARDVAVDWAT